jgi:hypothetical protein
VRSWIAIVGMLLLSSIMLAQKNVTTLGIQVKPLVPNAFLNFSEITSDSTSFSGTWTPKVSLNFGMAIRYGFSDAFSLETGIYIIRRKYHLQLNDFDAKVEGNIDYIMVGYEIPIQGAYYVQLGEDLWMNAAGGFSIDMNASNTFSASNLLVDTTYYDFEQYTARYRWVQFALVLNYGFEYRTKDKGSFYLGATYHQPFSPLVKAEGLIKYDDQIRRVNADLEGSYFTIDLRYYFHEDPERKKKKTKKGPKK